MNINAARVLYLSVVLGSSMAIFSRRSLQRLLGENSSFLSIKQTKDLVKKLNLGELSAEWEVVLLNAFSKVGNVAYERDFGGKRKGDIFFEDEKGSLLADVTSVSDKGLDVLNPVDALLTDFREIIWAAGLNPAAFCVTVGAGGNDHYKGGQRVRLKLPRRSQFGDRLFGAEFQGFLGALQGARDSASCFQINNDEIDLTIDYVPSGLHAAARWISYNVVYSLTENRIYDSLEDKAEQLEQTEFKGPVGIFLCDGGCSFLASKSGGNLSYSEREVILDFLEQYKFISFVVTFVVKRQRQFVSSPFDDNPYRVFADLYKGAPFGEMSVDMDRLLERIRYPTAQLSAREALAQQRQMPNTGSSHGGMMIQKPGIDETEIKISSRDLHELLAGRITQEQFFKRHEFLKQENPFNQALTSGKMTVEIELSPEDDDDWIIFKLKGPDPAITSFNQPTNKTK
jgi:hypothetical protein